MPMTRSSKTHESQRIFTKRIYYLRYVGTLAPAEIARAVYCGEAHWSSLLEGIPNIERKVSRRVRCP
jgi:hypothetical protein